MKKISTIIFLCLLALIVIYAVLSGRDISIETPIASVSSSAPASASNVAASAGAAQQPSTPGAKTADILYNADGPAILMLTRLTSIRPQEPGGEDSIYLKLGDYTTDIWKMKAGESVQVNRVVEAGTTVSLWERDGFRKDGDDDFLGSATLQAPEGKVRFEQPATGDHLYTLSYETN